MYSPHDLSFIVREMKREQQVFFISFSKGKKFLKLINVAGYDPTERASSRGSEKVDWFNCAHQRENFGCTSHWSATINQYR